MVPENRPVPDHAFRVESPLRIALEGTPTLVESGVVTWAPPELLVPGFDDSLSNQPDVVVRRRVDAEQ
jgi:hypothetical protein